MRKSEQNNRRAPAILRGLLAAVTALALAPEGAVQQRKVPEVRNTKAGLEAAPTLVLAEEVRLEVGSETGPAPWIIDLSVTGEGWIFLLDAGRGEVRFFDSQGTFRGTIGSSGTFFFPLFLGVARDSVIVLDRSPPVGGSAPGIRIRVFGLDGTVLATLDGQRAGGPSRSLFSLFLRLRGTARGWTLHRWINVPLPRRGRAGPVHDTSVVASFLPDLGETGRILSYPSAPRYSITDDLIRSPALSAVPRHAVGGDGRIYAHTGAEYVIEVRSHEGTLERRIVGEVDRIAVTEEDFEESVRREMKALRDRMGGMRDLTEETSGVSEPDSILDIVQRGLRWVGRSDFRPVLGSMFASEDGSVVVHRLDLADDPLAVGGAAKWDVIGPEGRILGRLATPPGITVRAFEWPYIYATRRRTGGDWVARFKVQIPGP